MKKIVIILVILVFSISLFSETIEHSILTKWIRKEYKNDNYTVFITTEKTHLTTFELFLTLWFRSETNMDDYSIIIKEKIK